MDNWGAVKAFLLGVWDAVASGARAAVDAVASAFDNAVNFVTGAGSAIAPGLSARRPPPQSGFSGAVVSGAADLLASAFGGAADVVSGLFSGMGARSGLPCRGSWTASGLGGLAAAISPGIFPARWDAGIGLFRTSGKRPRRLPGAREGILGACPHCGAGSRRRSRTSARGRLALRKPWVRPSPVRLKPWPRRFPV
ncbi:MAG: hypothetical protein ACLSTO_01135 [Bilophila wadsworthia]